MIFTFVYEHYMSYFLHFARFTLSLYPELDSKPACRYWPRPRSPIGGVFLGMVGKERKVRATQGIPLPNGKRFARVCKCRRK